MASTQDQLELLKIHQSNQDKYIYFLLAASAAGIALAIQLTTGKPLQCHHLILGSAIILWGASFWAGCRQLYWVQVCLAANYHLLQLHAGNHSKQPTTAQELEIAINETNKAIHRNTEKAGYYSKWQFRLIVAGAVVFISWHVYGMYIISIGT